jgi:predicted DNA-binding transcriptional regulator AlpA
MTSPTKQTWSFSLVLGGIAEVTPEIEDALFSAGCDDALLAFTSGLATLDFDREADSFAAAVSSAMADVTRAGLEIRVLRLAPDDLVSASELARRAGVSREAVRKWVEGDRRGGGFPAPRTSVGSSIVWSWLEVAGWLRQRAQVDERTVASARTTVLLNQILDNSRSQELIEEQVALEQLLMKRGAIATERGVPADGAKRRR